DLTTAWLWTPLKKGLAERPENLGTPARHFDLPAKAKRRRGRKCQYDWDGEGADLMFRAMIHSHGNFDPDAALLRRGRRRQDPASEFDELITEDRVSSAAVEAALIKPQLTCPADLERRVRKYLKWRQGGDGPVHSTAQKRVGEFL